MYRFVSLISIIWISLWPATAQEPGPSVIPCFYEARTHLEAMLSGEDPLSYEEAIFTIENAWYGNSVDRADFDRAIGDAAASVKAIAATQYNESAIRQKAGLFRSRQEIGDQYQQALDNWAIYTFITQKTALRYGGDTLYHPAFTYTCTDPMGTADWRNTQVIHLWNSHEGNCFALASLFRILSGRLQSGAELCTAPAHIYIRHKDDRGTVYNVELGSRNFPGTGAISAATYTTDQAIRSRIAQRPLDERQAVALCLVYLAKGYQSKTQQDTAPFILHCAEAALRYDSLSLSALLLKAEYLERQLIGQGKPPAQLQALPEFQHYQSLLVRLYDLGYREMPLEMKNTLQKLYAGEQVAETGVLPAATGGGRYATLSWGLFDERHSQKASERYGNTVLDTRTRKIRAFATPQSLYNNYDFDPAVFAMNVDPMTFKYPSLSPYAVFNGNPIVFNDVDGDDWYKDKKSGSIQYDPKVQGQKDLNKGQKYLGDTYEEKQRGKVDYREDGSIKFANETDAYNRIWNNTKMRQREEMAVIQKGGVLVLPSYSNYYNESKIEEYGYQFSKGKLYDPVSKTMTPFLATIHVHPGGTSASGVDGDIGYFPKMTPNKPAFIWRMDSQKYLSALIGVWKTDKPDDIRHFFLGQKDLNGATGEKILNGFSLIKLLNANQYPRISEKK